MSTPSQNKSVEWNGMESRSSDHEDNVSAISRIHSIQDGEEKGVYFSDGLRKIDLVLAYEGKKHEISQYVI